MVLVIYFLLKGQAFGIWALTSGAAGRDENRRSNGCVSLLIQHGVMIDVQIRPGCEKVFREKFVRLMRDIFQKCPNCMPYNIMFRAFISFKLQLGIVLEITHDMMIIKFLDRWMHKIHKRSDTESLYGLTTHSDKPKDMGELLSWDILEFHVYYGRVYRTMIDQIRLLEMYLKGDLEFNSIELNELVPLVENAVVAMFMDELAYRMKTREVGFLKKHNKKLKWNKAGTNERRSFLEELNSWYLPDYMWDRSDRSLEDKCPVGGNCKVRR